MIVNVVVVLRTNATNIKYMSSISHHFSTRHHNSCMSDSMQMIGANALPSDHNMLVTLMTNCPLVVSHLKAVQARCLDRGIHVMAGHKHLDNNFSKHINTYYTR